MSKMELKVLIQQLKKRLWIIVGTTLLGVIAGWGVVSFVPVRYEASLSIYVQKIIEQSMSGEYTYDGYYAQQAAEAYTDTVMGLLESPDVAASALMATGLNSDTIVALKRSLKVEKVAPQIVHMAVTQTDQQAASELVMAVTKIATDRVQQLDTQTSGYTVETVNDEPLIVVQALPSMLTIRVGGLLGLMVSVGFLAFWVYLRTDGE